MEINLKKGNNEILLLRQKNNSENKNIFCSFDLVSEETMNLNILIKNDNNDELNKCNHKIDYYSWYNEVSTTKKYSFEYVLNNYTEIYLKILSSKKMKINLKNIEISII